MLGRARRSLGQLASPRWPTSSAGPRWPPAPAGSAIVLILTLESVGVLVALGRLAGRDRRGRGRPRARAAVEPPRTCGCGRTARSRRHGWPPATSAARCTTPSEAAAVALAADFHAAGQPGWCLGAALTAAGEPDRAVDAAARPRPCCRRTARRSPPTSSRPSSPAATSPAPRPRWWPARARGRASPARPCCSRRAARRRRRRTADRAAPAAAAGARRRARRRGAPPAAEAPLAAGTPPPRLSSPPARGSPRAARSRRSAGAPRPSTR